jgi:hypothetical protein
VTINLQSNKVTLIGQFFLNAFVVSKLTQREDWVQHTEWKDRQGRLSPNGNILQFPIRGVLYPFNTTRAPVGNIVVDNLVLKPGQGHGGSLFRDRALLR